MTIRPENDLIASARTQYRAAFKAMATGAAHDLCLTKNGGVILDRAFEHSCILVRDVGFMSEDRMILTLSASLRKFTENLAIHALENAK